ncbi:MAG: hypothetical protein ACMUIP_06610 [bacterium]
MSYETLVAEKIQNPTEEDFAGQKAPASGQLHQTFKCQSCAAKMEFKPGSNVQACPYCGHENHIPRSEEDIEKLDFHEYLAKASSKEDLIEQLTLNVPCAPPRLLPSLISPARNAFSAARI